MKSRAGSDGVNIEHGVYQAVLKSANIYSSDNFNSGEREINMTLVWDLGQDENGNDLLFYDGFIRIPTDRDGFPQMSGNNSKLYNRISALAGVRFDVADVGSKIDVEYRAPEEWDSPEAWAELPHWQTLKGDDNARIELDILINGVSVIGKRVDIEIGNVQKPDGTLSTRTSVVNAGIPPKARGKVRDIEPIAENEAVAELPV